jgi:hypothetical protein
MHDVMVMLVVVCVCVGGGGVHLLKPDGLFAGVQHNSGRTLPVAVGRSGQNPQSGTHLSGTDAGTIARM